MRLCRATVRLGAFRVVNDELVALLRAICRVAERNTWNRAELAAARWIASIAVPIQSMHEAMGCGRRQMGAEARRGGTESIEPGRSGEGVEGAQVVWIWRSRQRFLAGSSDKRMVSLIPNWEAPAALKARSLTSQACRVYGASRTVRSLRFRPLSFNQNRH